MALKKRIACLEERVSPSERITKIWRYLMPTQEEIDSGWQLAIRRSYDPVGKSWSTESVKIDVKELMNTGRVIEYCLPVLSSTT